MLRQARRPSWKTLGAGGGALGWAILCAPGLASAAAFGDVAVVVQGVRSAEGHVRVELCVQSVFLTSDCTPSQGAVAQVGDTVVRFAAVPPGTYAVQAYHDRNDDGRVNRGALGIPVEDLGFSRNAPLSLRGPSFARAAIVHGADDQTVAVRLRHFWALPRPLRR